MIEVSLETIVALGLVVFYLVEILQFDGAGRSGPMESRRIQIVRVVHTNQTVQNFSAPANFFDYVRRWFRAYTVVRDEDGDEVWFVRDRAIKVWECPICLSFWMSVTVMAIIAPLYGLAILHTVIYTLAITAVSTILHVVINKYTATEPHDRNISS